MTEIKYPIRQAIRAQDMTQEKLAIKFKISRQTLSRYLKKFETDGSVSNPEVQREFERLMAMEKQRLSGYSDNGSRLKLARMSLQDATEKERNNRVKYDRLLRDILSNHPDVPMIDWEGNTVSADTLELENMWVNFGFGDNDGLEAVLTEAERSRLEEIQEESSDTFMQSRLNSRMEQACLSEQLWDSTETGGKPIIYHDTFECALSEEEAKAGLYRFECDSFCMCCGGTARIYADGLNVPLFEHDVELDFHAAVEVITDKGLMYIGTVRLKNPDAYPFRFVGQIDDLIPGYKYVYSLGITAGDYDEVDDLEYTLLEGYSSRESHPLK